MSNTTESATRPEAAQEEIHTALFAQLVVQQNNMAMMFLGKIPNPEDGKATRNIEAARLFIDQLEMLEAKTKGNLTKEEAALLKQSLMQLRLAFVDAVNSPEPQETQAKPGPGPTEPAAAAEESHKKFSKKY